MPTREEILSAIDLVTAMETLLATPDKWTQRHLARTSKGNPIGPQEDNAACWCLMGAAYKTASDREQWSVVRTAMWHHMKVGIDLWNDASNRTHAEVLQLLADVKLELREKL